MRPVGGSGRAAPVVTNTHGLKAEKRLGKGEGLLLLLLLLLPPSASVLGGAGVAAQMRTA